MEKADQAESQLLWVVGEVKETLSVNTHISNFTSEQNGLIDNVLNNFENVRQGTKKIAQALIRVGLFA